MIKIEKPGTHKKGLKVLVYGDTGVGKTIFALSFPKSLALDTEDGYEWYENTDKAKNLVGIARSQSFDDLSDLLDQLDSDNEEFDTFIIDSETKIYENIQEALLDVEERRARKKRRDELDANISQRSWGKIKQLALRLQNAKLRLASDGVNVVSVAQSADVMENAGETMVKVGEKPDMHKKAKYDYDVKLRLFTKDGKYFAEVDKDRTDTFKKGEIIENPSYDNWKDKVEGKDNQGDVVKVDYTQSMEKSKKAYEAEVKTNMTFEERIQEHVTGLDKEAQQEFINQMVAIAGTKKIKEMSAEAKQEILEKLVA
ncbi:AAA family ATPase [Limosilactobacillus reuteri]|uniref:AAA family ATPase n=1 Tax=Limosilactobacillus reuteri TaxID=1598 RepID=UPI001E3F5142|nr:AAA family ATPase [Limosilactobacillus reuteri]MCC4466441.1 ATP-binding protein [Limosilactobacillus reuteri]MCC4474217.1 ATP-binding protein [Limosilactobacillus reuteri]